MKSSYRQKVFEFIMQKDVVEKYSSHSTSYKTNLHIDIVTYDVAKILGLQDCMDYYMHKIEREVYDLKGKDFYLSVIVKVNPNIDFDSYSNSMNDINSKYRPQIEKHIEECFEDQILDACNIVGKLEYRDKCLIGNWSLFNLKRFTHIHMSGILSGVELFGNKYCPHFVPPIDVISYLRTLELLNPCAALVLLGASLLEDNLEIFNWVLENYDILHMEIDGYNFLYGSQIRNIFTAYKSVCSIYESIPSISHLNLYANFPSEMIRLTRIIYDLLEHECKKRQSFKTKITSYREMYAVTISRLIKYASLAEPDNECFHDSRIEKSFEELMNIMYIMGDSPECTDPIIIFNETLDHNVLMNIDFSSNYANLFVKPHKFGFKQTLRIYTTKKHEKTIFELLVQGGHLEDTLPGFRISDIKDNSELFIPNVNAAVKYEIGDQNYELLTLRMSQHPSASAQHPTSYSTLRTVMKSADIRKEIHERFGENFFIKSINNGSEFVIECSNSFRYN